MIKIKNVNINNSTEELKEILSVVTFIKEHIIQQDMEDLIQEMNNFDMVDDMAGIEKEKKPLNVVKYDFDLNEEFDDEELEQNIVNVLKYISNNKVKLQSNFSRYNAILVATCASQGFITNIDEDNQIVNYWKLTLDGVLELKKVGV